MRVLDVGSGAGDVSFLAAELVGDDGSVTGVDRSAEAVATARAAAVARALTDVSFVLSDLDALTVAQPFDAIIGRYVLEWLPHPARRLSGLRQSGEAAWSFSTRSTGADRHRIHRLHSSTLLAVGS